MSSRDFRGAHLDLNAQTLTFDYVSQIISRLGSMGYNTLVLEYGNRFPYANTPDIAAPHALTAEQIRELVRLAGQYGMQVVPLIQSLGHFEFVLKHKAYADLCENLDSPEFQLCPSHPQSVPLVCAMLDELIAAHPQADFLHIGGDETWSLGHCPKCRQRVEAVGKSGLYVDHIAAICEHVLATGKRPILWADMVLAHPQALDKLDRRIVFMDWDYNTDSLRQSKVNIRHWGWFDADNLDDAPLPLREMFEPYWKSHVSDYPAGFTGWPYVSFLKDLGFDVITAPAVRCFNDNYSFPQLNVHLRNIESSVAAARRDGALGTCVTSWPVRRTPWPTTWLGFEYGASCMDESAEVENPSDFLKSRIGEELAPLLTGLVATTGLYNYFQGSDPLEKRFFGKEQRWPACDEPTALSILKDASRAADLLKEHSDPADDRSFWRYAAMETAHKARQLALLNRARSCTMPSAQTIRMIGTLLEEMEALSVRFANLFQGILTADSITEEQAIRFCGEREFFRRFVAKR